MRREISDILAFVEKPYRYIGGEVGVSKKSWDDTRARLCLAFPDTYELGMSNTGLSILYDIVNREPDMLAERVFAPWLDMEAELRKRKLPLFSIESCHSISEFDVLGIGLPYELSYTNVLTILSLSGIPLRAKDRDDLCPIILGGGPCAFNPEPVADFFDAIVIGEGEPAIIKIMRAVCEGKEKGYTRQNVLKNISEIEGVYIPSYGTSKKIKKSFISELEDAPYPKAPVVPYAATHDRVGIEVSRGCTRGCRFCHAGFIYRPTRHRKIDTVVNLAQEQLQSSGHDELSFLSLSLGDYPSLCELLSNVHNMLSGKYVNIQFPSLRVEALSENILNLMDRARSGSFTLAPEAATERMRKIINKGNTDDDLYKSVEKIFTSGFHQIKLYFMIGLPFETDAELEGIVSVANRCLDIGKRYNKKAEVTVSTSTFVPKAHTPFQWAAQLPVEAILEKQSFLKKNLRRRDLYYKWHDARMSFLECIFARGDRRLSFVIEKAHNLGARFDAWDENFNFACWQEAFDSCNVKPSEYAKSYSFDTKFAWDHLYTELKKEFLWKEFKKAHDGVSTDDCANGKCTGCGVCVKNSTSSFVHRTSQTKPQDFTKYDVLSTKYDFCAIRDLHKYRFKYTKLGKAAFLGHLELMNVLRRSIRSVGLSLLYSQGFHPHPKMSFSKALAVGIESECEYCDLELSMAIDPVLIKRQLHGAFPEGINVVEIRDISQNALSIDKSITASEFEVVIPADLPAMQACKARQAGAGIQWINMAKRFNESEEVLFSRERRGKVSQIDLKKYITTLAVLDNSVIRITLNEIEPSVRITEVVQNIFNLSESVVKSLHIRKIAVIGI